MSNLYKRLKRIAHPRILRYLASSPRVTINSVHHHLSDGRWLPVETLNQRPLVHVANFTTGNAGDALLTTVLRDLFSQQIGGLQWSKLHAHDVVGASELARINAATGVVVGGGGLFLKDSNPNRVSGWQWPISVQAIHDLNVPLILFAVGYNRFRQQGDFDPLFGENVVELIRKASFVGMRNYGSVRGIRSYLPEELHSKVVYQPCMTTLISRIYPERFQGNRAKQGFIAVNCAFDRSQLRFAGREEEILGNLASALKVLGQEREIRYFSHSKGDENFLPYLDRAGVRYTVNRLFHRKGEEIIADYQAPDLVIGMRGHAQMIPFGCGTPILSLISHDKMRWFLDDIGHNEWGLELTEPDLQARVVATARKLIATDAETRADIATVQDRLLQITLENLTQIKKCLVPFG